MSARYRITFAGSAIGDPERIEEWYVEQGVASTGARVVAELVEQAESLSQLPERGRVVPEFATPNLRELIHPPFRIVHRLDPGRVRVVRVWRSERELRLPAG